MLDARVWLLWALTVLVAASSTRNPLYIVLLLLTMAVVAIANAPRQRKGLPSLSGFGVVAVPLAALFNGLTVHYGETVLFSLPAQLPLLGGPVTLEALVYGAINGLILTAIFSGFSTFNRVMPARDLVRLTPRAFHETGVVLSIALTFVPQMTRSLNEIREAQAVRGHRVRGLRDWLPIFVPLLVGGLERALGLAEAMIARGYGAVSDQVHSLRAQVLLALGLTMLLLGWLAYLFLPQQRTAAIGGMVAGAGFVVGLLWQAGRSVTHTTYRKRRWTARESLVALGCGVMLALLLAPLPFVSRETLTYSPYPRLALPALDLGLGLGILGLLVPALVARTEETASDD
ncbi:MAG: energy-coupling factor transporter transmembrane protein EcfT [Anaerolineales bacterium]|nr:energy-coupling factor transporter transmembrane protein EcfT [Anaerolineales bacterium]